MTKYVQKQLDEIQQHQSLIYYGFALALTHIWTFLYWHRGSFFITSQSATNTEPICFPFWPQCDLIRSAISQDIWQWILYLYLFLGTLSALFFLSRHLLKQAYILLFAVTLLKFLLHMSNYNFMGNYHYMVYFITFCYLFVPQKLKTIPTLIVAFYFAAGTLKLNIDWLSGAAMIRTPYLSGHILTVSLYYVLFLELIFVFGLLSGRKLIRFAVLGQLIAFHAISWHIVGFYYPMVMFSLLSLFFLDAYFEDDHPLFIKAQGFSLSLPTIGVLVAFTFMQALPFLVIKDPSVSGAARLSSLNMFDSKTHCHSLLVAETNQGTIHIQKPNKNLGTRLKCDPIVYLNQAYQICRKNRQTGEIKALHLSLFTKRVTQQKFIKTLDLRDFCTLSYPLWAEIYKGRQS